MLLRASVVVRQDWKATTTPTAVTAVVVAVVVVVVIVVVAVIVVVVVVVVAIVVVVAVVFVVVTAVVVVAVLADPVLVRTRSTRRYGTKRCQGDALRVRVAGWQVVGVGCRVVCFQRQGLVVVGHPFEIEVVQTRKVL